MLHHLEINVSNLDRSKQFLGWLLTELGYEEFQRWESGIRKRRKFKKSPHY